MVMLNDNDYDDLRAVAHNDHNDVDYNDNDNGDASDIGGDDDDKGFHEDGGDESGIGDNKKNINKSVNWLVDDCQKN